MASQKRTVDYLLGEAMGTGAVSTKPMFGDYGVYVDGKMIGSSCDDRLYVKPTASGRLHAEPVSEAPHYPGAKPHLLSEADRWDDAAWLGGLLRATAAKLPTQTAGIEAHHISPHDTRTLQGFPACYRQEDHSREDPVSDAQRRLAAVYKRTLVRLGSKPGVGRIIVQAGWRGRVIKVDDFQDPADDRYRTRRDRLAAMSKG